MIIRMEMALFDLKEGFCSSSWGSPKRFCCTPKHPRLPGTGDTEVCGDWIEWGEFFTPHDENGPAGDWLWGRSEFLAYGIVAVRFPSRLESGSSRAARACRFGFMDDGVSILLTAIYFEGLEFSHASVERRGHDQDAH